MTDGKPDWANLRLAFITDPAKPTPGEFAGKIGIKEKTVQNRASAEKWLTDREAHWEQVGKLAGEKVADLQATVVARDTSQQLAAIAAMKHNALKFAGGVEGREVVYEKPHEAVAAYERLVKLERLILGDSTEHIKVDDARGFARDVLAIVRRRVTDPDVLELIAGDVAALSVGGGPSIGTDRPALN